MSTHHTAVCLTVLAGVLLLSGAARGAEPVPARYDLTRLGPFYPYPFRGTDWLEDYASTMTRDGMHYIGSTGYRYIYYGRWLDWMHPFHTARKKGLKLKRDPLDFGQFPKHAAFFDSFFDLLCAGGYYIPNGDTSDTPVEGRRIYRACFNYNPRLLELSWKLSRDPRFAWLLVNVPAASKQLAAFSRAEKEQIRAAAASVKRNPFLAQRSRVLGGFGLNVLEDGADSDDYRFKRTLILHAGTSIAHHHCDVLNLQLFAHGCRMTNAMGCRDDHGTNFPKALSTHMQNVVDVQSDDWPWPWLAEERTKPRPDTTADEVDAEWNNIGNFPGEGEGWLRSFKALPGCMYAAAGAASGHHPELKLYRRQSAMITIDPGRPATKPPRRRLYGQGTRHDPKVVTPSLYVFDVFRVAGGKIHTWCFHGCESDAFSANVPVKPVREDKLGPTHHNIGDCGHTPAEHWLRYHPVGVKTAGLVPDKHEGTAGDVFEASWRLSRAPNPPGLTMRVSMQHKVASQSPDFLSNKYLWPKTGIAPMYKRNAEKAQLAADYDAQAPRKVTKITLLGHKGGHVMYARGASARTAYAYNLPFLYVQHRGKRPDMQSVWPAVIEPYAGESKIKRAALLSIPLAGSEAGDALRPVAVELQTTFGFAEVCFADGRPDKRRTVPFSGGELRAAGEVARYRFDAAGLRGLTLINGTELRGPAGGVRVADRQRRGRITKVDYPGLRIWVDGDFSADAVIGEELLVENAHLAVPPPADAMKYRSAGDGHRTSLTVVAARRQGRQTVLRARRSFLLSRAVVLGVDARAGVVTLSHAPVLGANPNRRAGLVFGNESGTKFWRGSFLDGVWRRGKCRYRLTGATLKRADLTDADGNGRLTMLTWDLGVGDVARLPAHVQLQRTKPGLYELRANTGATFSLRGTKVHVSGDGRTWKPLPAESSGGGRITFDVNLSDLHRGRGFLRIAP